MEKEKLSDLISRYQDKIEKKDDFFDLYFEEKDLEQKLAVLKLMYQSLGEVVMPYDYFKTFLYAGHWYGNKNYFKITESMIIDVYDIIKEYDQMPIEIIDSLLYHYDEECFKKYQVKEYFDVLVSEYGFTDETKERCIEYIEKSKNQLKDFYKNECDKLESIKEEYPYEFVSGLKDIITSHHMDFNELMSVLPSNTLFKPTSESESEFWAKYNDYRFMFELLKGKINLDNYEDDEHVVVFEKIGQYENGIGSKKMYTSFTKKEYLDAIKEEKVRVKTKDKMN